MQKCAIYIRVSTEEQKINGLSINTQKEVLTEYAIKHNMNIVDYYIDAGLTARKRLSHRKELQRLLEDVKTGSIDIIIFTKLDRWFRNIADYYKVQEILNNCHVNWKTIYENYDTSTANGRLYINIMLSIAQDEADRTSERIKVVFDNKRARGEIPGWKAPLGYKIEHSKLIINNQTSQIAIDIFNYYDLHHSVMGCVRMAREKYNYNIYDYSIRRMLENKIYIGEFRGFRDFCTPLIPEEQFYRIKSYREVREFKNQLVAGRVYLFSSLIICKECSHNMSSCFTIQKQKVAKKEYHYYRCKESINNHNCIHKKRINEEYLENYLLNKLYIILMNYTFYFDYKEINEPKVTANITKLRTKLEKLKDLYLDDMIDKNTYKIEYESLSEQLDKFSSKKPSSIMNSSIMSKKLNYDFKNIYTSFSLKERKVFWLGLLDKILVGKDNNIEIFYKQ